MRALADRKRSDRPSPRQFKEQIDQTQDRDRAGRAPVRPGQSRPLRYGSLPELEQQLEAENRSCRKCRKPRRLLKEEVDAEDIAEVVASWTGIPVSRLLEGEMQKLLHMEDRLRQRVVGQDEAILAVSNAVRRARAGLQDPTARSAPSSFSARPAWGRPNWPRALAEFLFDDERAMIRIDMSEYQEKHTVSRLIGAPPGYVGYEEGGQLTEAVRRRPYSVVLFDEIEKAHAEVFNVLCNSWMTAG